MLASQPPQLRLSLVLEVVQCFWLMFTALGQKQLFLIADILLFHLDNTAPILEMLESDVKVHE